MNDFSSFTFADDRYRPILKSVMDGRTNYINAVIVTVKCLKLVCCKEIECTFSPLKSYFKLVSITINICLSLFIFQQVNKTVNYIITQSPVKDTIADLWRMMNDYNCKIIVMLESEGVISNLDHIF